MSVVLVAILLCPSHLEIVMGKLNLQVHKYYKLSGVYYFYYLFSVQSFICRYVCLSVSPYINILLLLFLLTSNYGSPSIACKNLLELISSFKLYV